MCAGAAWGSARLQAGGTDVKEDGQEQLGQDAAPWLTGRQLVGLRVDSADSCQDLVSSYRRKGWDDSGSVTDPRQKAPILRLGAARGLREDEGEPLDAAGQERALAVAYRPARGPEEPVGGVLRHRGRGAAAAQSRAPAGAQVARRRAEGPAPGAHRSPLKPYEPVEKVLSDREAALK